MAIGACSRYVLATFFAATGRNATVYTWILHRKVAINTAGARAVQQTRVSPSATEQQPPLEQLPPT